MFIESIQNKNYQNSAEIVHKIKHKISILGLTETYALAVKHEELLKLSSDQLVSDFSAALNKLTDYINKI